MYFFIAYKTFSTQIEYYYNPKWNMDDTIPLDFE